ncbi:MAG TPA: acyl-CoA thioesterase [Firmicutes bacterium]|nr:acyl-CoA thioesterase [Candidatus Fermentithermobacillaceae bacterium]
MISLEPVIVARLIKEEDLNHHGTLFAGRMAEWFIEACFIAACRTIGRPEEVVCLKLHGLEFTNPASKGDILTFRTFPVRTGRTSLTVFGRVIKNDSPNPMVDGFVTFVKVDTEGRPVPHGIVLPEPRSEEERRIREIAENLR